MAADLADVRRELQAQDIDILRLVWPDVLGITRAEDITVSQLERAAGHGPAFCQGTWVTTTGGCMLPVFFSASVAECTQFGGGIR